MCDSVTSFEGQIIVFMDTEDSSEGLVKVAMCKKVYKCLEVCQASWTR